MQRVIQCHKLLRRMQTKFGLDAQAIHPTKNALVEFRVQAHRVVDRTATLDEAGQNLVDVAAGESIVRAVVTHGALRARTRAIPEFTDRVPVAYEQNELALRTLRHQHRNCFRFGKTGQVPEIAVLTVLVFHIAVAIPHWRRGQDGDGTRTHRLHELPAAARKLFAAQAWCGKQWRDGVHGSRPLVPRRRTGSRQPESALAQWREFFEHQLCTGAHILNELDIVRLGRLLLFHRRFEVRSAGQFGEVFQHLANLTGNMFRRRQTAGTEAIKKTGAPGNKRSHALRQGRLVIGQQRRELHGLPTQSLRGLVEHVLEQDRQRMTAVLVRVFLFRHDFG